MATLVLRGKSVVPRPVLAALALAWIWPLAQAAAGAQVLTGVIAMDHADDFANPAQQYPVLEVGGERLALDNVAPDELTPGTRVSVLGRRVGDTIWVDRNGIRPARQDSALAAGTTAADTMSKRVAVLMVNFVSPTPTPSPTPSPSPSPTDSPQPSDSPLPTDPLSTDPLPTASASPSPTDTPVPSDSPAPTAPPTEPPPPTPSPSPTPAPPEPWTADFVRGVYFTNTRSVADYYAEVSDGLMSVTGDVFGWLTVPADTSACNYLDWDSAARDAAAAAGIDLSAYTNVAYVFPKQAACWWIGMAALPGRNSHVNGSASWSYATWLFVASHELGHNFGMNHASTITCTSGGVRVAFSDDCTTDEYGDSFDTMGHDGQRHFNTWHRWQMGLLGASDVQTVTESGGYRVATAEVTGGVPRVLRVARPSGNYYYLEFRQPYGRYDNFSPTAAVVNGVSIRIAPGVGSLAFSKLIDTVPQTSTFYDAALGVGRGFADNINDIFVVTQAIDPTGATVLVHIGPDTVLPTPPGAAQATSDADGTITLSWQPATDDVFVAGYQVARDGRVLGTYDSTSLTEPGLPQAATYSYSVRAVDGAGNFGDPTLATIYLPDTTPPGSAAPITATSTGPHGVALSWRAASDNVGVSSYQVWRNGGVIGTTMGTTFDDTAAPDGIVLTYQVQALDAAGNAGSSASATLTLPDVTSPDLSGDLVLAVTASGDIDVTWPAATDNVGIAGYVLSRDGAPLSTVTGNAYLDPGLAQARTYQYSVAASDAAGNPSQTLSGFVYLPDLLAPSIPTYLNVVQSGPRAVDLDWAAATDNVGVVGYQVSRDGVQVAALDASARTYRETGLVSGRTYTYTLTAVDAAGNAGAGAVAQVTLPPVDSVSPSVPLGLRAVALSGRRVSLSWAPSTDNNAGVISYRVFRGRTRIATVTVPSYADRPAVSGWYKYRVKAVDAAGNVSSFSVAVRVKAHA